MFRLAKKIHIKIKKEELFMKWITNIHKRTSIFVIGCTVLTFSFFSQANAKTSVSSSNYQKENICISVQKKQICFTKLPTDKRFSKILVSLYSKDGRTLSKQSLTRKNVVYRPKNIKNGIYHLQLYSLKMQDEKGIHYSSYWYQNEGIALKKDSKGWHFYKTQVYKSNKQAGSFSKKNLQDYLQSDYLIDTDDKAIIKTAKIITKGLNKDYDKVLAVHDWVAKNIYFDYDFLYEKSGSLQVIASDVLKSRKTICQGYADLSAALLRAIGIPTRVVEGYTIGFGNSEAWTKDIIKSDVSNHVWNASYVNGRWVMFDTTWDTQNIYENGQYISSPPLHQYFDPTLYTLSSTHRITKK